MKKWQVWVDTGGTFTDCLAVTPEGAVRQVKVLSSSALRGRVVETLGARGIRVAVAWSAPSGFPVGFRFQGLGSGDGARTVAFVTGYDAETGVLTLDQLLESDWRGRPFELCSPEEAPVLAARLVTGTLPTEPLPPMDFRLATTRGTNALLTRTGTSPLLFLNTGFADLLTIGTQQRPDLFVLDIHKPEPLYQAVVEVRGRLAADGTELVPLDEDALRKAATQAVARGVRQAAVALLHATVNPAHEKRVAEILRECGFTQVSLSSEIAPFVKILPRAETALVNAYLSPVLDHYLAAVQKAAPEVHLMTSAGGLVSAAQFRPKDSLLSGPAGGIVGAVRAAEMAGFSRILAFDMGGTSTDVARCDGGFEYTFEHTVGAAHLVAPALAIESVAAGGGSICAFDARGPRVGPESAGAFPGPACYGAGGPLTITDVNLLVGHLPADSFEIPVSREAAQLAAQQLLSQINQDRTKPVTLEWMLHGFLEIANERMADAIRRISTRRGYDPSGYALLCFGGAGGQHACAVAELLGMTTVLVPADASLLSAWGIGQAALERIAARQILRPLHEVSPEDQMRLVQELEAEAQQQMMAEGVSPETNPWQTRCIASLRLLGQETTLDIDFQPGDALGDLFRIRYRAIYGTDIPPRRKIELEAVRVVVSQVVGEAACVSSEETTDSPLWQRREGGRLLVGRHSTIVVAPGWQVSYSSTGTAILRRVTTPAPAPALVTASNGLTVMETGLFTARFSAIAEEMGEMLQRMSVSVNVKERLDFSCAVLGPNGDLIATAAHIPVHLGALSECVRRVRETLPLAAGDTVIVNHPGYGGSHLPDITLITPVFSTQGQMLGYVANRAHHAEVGGKRPGSMPPQATVLTEEGVVLPPLYLVWNGESQLDAVLEKFTTATWPSRNPEENRTDILAALAANYRGVALVQELAVTQGVQKTLLAMEMMTQWIADLTAECLRRLPTGIRTAEESLDDGSLIRVAVTVQEGRATFDFSGTSPTHTGNLNAPPAVVRSAVMYVLRLLIQTEIPLNDGLLRPVTLILPENSLVNPTFSTDPDRCPAVVGGNTETSQKIVAALLKALELAAGSQGTMNNVLFGNAQFGYYETVCGGVGATRNGSGADAVHTHMTNTRITDVEILERRYPVRVHRFAVRPGSGGQGKHRGGNGVIRDLEFLAPVSVSLVTQNRCRGPYGLHGGENGLTGSQYLLRTNGEIEPLPAISATEAQPGDHLVLFTPGGGGWGSSDSHLDGTL